MPAAQPPRRVRWSLFVLYAGIAAALLRYHGLQHDAQAYVLQALATLNPAVFAGDLFLKFGSQDRYTLFSNLAALSISAMGIDHGAALLTAVALVLFFIAAWVLVRTLTNAAFAWLAVGLLMVIPGWYGSGAVFQVAERFLSARLPAQALCLLAIAAWATRWHMVAALLFGLAAIVHPLMTMPALCVVVAAQVTGTHRLLTTQTVGVGLLAAVLLAGLALGWRDPWMRGDWLLATRARSDFLFLDQWRLADWRHLPVIGATLLLGARSLAGEVARRVIHATLLVAVVGLVAAAVVSWGPSIKWVIQAQTWRWVWPATVLAIGLLPATLLHLRHDPKGGTCSALLLLAAWVLATADRSNESLHAVAIATAALAATVPAIWSHIPAAAHTTATRAAGLVNILAAVWLISLLATEAALNLDLGGDPVWVQRVIAVLGIPAIGAALVTAVWFGLQSVWRRWVGFATGIAGLALLVAAAPHAWESWSSDRFGPRTQERFAPWRTVIDLEAEVFWPDQLQATWFALGRRSYLSKSQLGGIVFSADTTAEARKRAQALAAVFPPGQWFNEMAGIDRTLWASSLAKIRAACAVPDISFVVANANFGTNMPPIEWPMPGQRIYLYDCIELRQRAS